MHVLQSNTKYLAMEVKHHYVQATCKLVSGNQEEGPLAQHSPASTQQRMQQFVGHLHVYRQ